MEQIEIELYGETWKKEMMKKSKKELVGHLVRICCENISQQFELQNLKTAQQ